MVRVDGEHVTFTGLGGALPALVWSREKRLDLQCARPSFVAARDPTDPVKLQAQILEELAHRLALRATRSVEICV